MDEEMKSKVYVKTDGQSRIIRCEGGYTTPTDLTGWVQIDEGYGDRYNLCQSNYFYAGLYTDDGIPRYKLVDGNPVEREESEIDSDRLDPKKEVMIQKSKSDLSDYLEIHPLQWTDGEYYSITAEKQQQLTSKIMSATMAQAMSTDYQLTWNSTGEVCKEWSLENLTALAFAIDSRVTKLVSYQQEKEVEIRNADTMDALNAIEVDYDAVE